MTSSDSFPSVCLWKLPTSNKGCRFAKATDNRTKDRIGYRCRPNEYSCKQLFVLHDDWSIIIYMRESNWRMPSSLILVTQRPSSLFLFFFFFLFMIVKLINATFFRRVSFILFLLSLFHYDRDFRNFTELLEKFIVELL